jgi:hypothetical protein
VKSTSETIAVRQVMRKFGVGEPLVSAVYSELIKEGHLHQTATGRYKRI